MAERAEEFSAYVAARQQHLVRTGFLLTGDHHAAEDLVQSALARTYLSWDRIRDKGSLDAYVRRVMVNEHTAWWRRAWRRRERSTDSVPEPRGPATYSPVESDPGERDEVSGAREHAATASAGGGGAPLLRGPQ